MSSTQEEYERQMAALREQHWAAFQRDMAAAKAAEDPLRHDRQLFLMLLIEARLGKKLSQAKLAAKLDTSQSVIARIESGRGNPGLNTLLAVAQALDVKLVLE
jgi:ribosome-binding protein aMBF1 (putative translation factor)